MLGRKSLGDESFDVLLAVKVEKETVFARTVPEVRRSPPDKEVLPFVSEVSDNCDRQ